MATANYSLRIDADDKKKAEQVFKALGMTFSTGINIYIKAVGRKQQIPFSLSLDDQVIVPLKFKASRSEKEQAFNAVNGILAGHDINLDREKEDRILSQ